MLLHFFPFSKQTIELNIDGEVHKGWRMYIVIATFIVTILLWIIPENITGINTNTVAMIPMGVFAISVVITAKDLQQIDWSVIHLAIGVLL